MNRLRYGHWGRAVLFLPSEQGRATDFVQNGIASAVSDLLEAGRLKAYCVDSFDHESWSNQSIPLEERARRHGFYERWILDEVVPWIYEDCGGRQDIITLGCSLGAFHAANFALKHADRFPRALCFSGNYDPSSWNAWGERGNEAYFNNPMDYVPNMHGAHLDWLRSRLNLLLVCGQGQWDGRPWGCWLGASDAAGPSGLVKASATSWTCGVTTFRTTGRHGAPRSRITCRVLS